VLHGTYDRSLKSITVNERLIFQQQVYYIIIYHTATRKHVGHNRLSKK